MSVTYRKSKWKQYRGCLWPAAAPKNPKHLIAEYAITDDIFSRPSLCLGLNSGTVPLHLFQSAPGKSHPVATVVQDTCRGYSGRICRCPSHSLEFLWDSDSKFLIVQKWIWRLRVEKAVSIPGTSPIKTVHFLQCVCYMSYWNSHKDWPPIWWVIADNPFT